MLINLYGSISRYGTPSYFILPSGWPWIFSCNACQIVYFHFSKEEWRFFIAILQMRDVIVIYIANIALMALNIQKLVISMTYRVDNDFAKKCPEVVRSRLTYESLNTSLQYFLATCIFHFWMFSKSWIVFCRLCL